MKNKIPEFFDEGKVLQLVYGHAHVNQHDECLFQML